MSTSVNKKFKPPIMEGLLYYNYSSNIAANSSPSIFSFSNNTCATFDNLSILLLNIVFALLYASSIILFTSSSIFAAVSSLKFLVCAKSLPKNTSSCPENDSQKP